MSQGQHPRRIVITESVHRLANKLQSALGSLELLLDQYDRALLSTKEALPELRRITAAIEDFCVMLPRDGSVVVVPHGTRVVSSDDVTEMVDSDEVRVVQLSQVKPGQGKRNRKTA